MKFDAHAIGQRIMKARDAKGIRTPKDLAKLLVGHTTTKGDKVVKQLSAETVRLWETGQVIPPYDKLEQLEAVLGVSTEELLFGEKRAAQLANERPRLVYVTEQESELLYILRHCNEVGRERIKGYAAATAKDCPAETAAFHVLMPKK